MRVKSYIVRVLCMSSLVCLSVGPVALLYICAALLRSQEAMSLYKPAPCDVINMTSVNHTCRCGNQSHWCSMRQHCVEVKVKTKVNTVLLRHTPPSHSDTRGSNYTLCSMTSCEDDLNNGTSSTVESFTQNPCSLGPCDPKSANGSLATMDDLLETVSGTSRQNLTCYVNPNDTSHALWRLEKERRMLTGLVWPLVTIATGLLFSIIARICTHGKD